MGFIEAYRALTDAWAFSSEVEEPTTLPVVSLTILYGLGPLPFFTDQGIVVSPNFGTATRLPPHHFSRGSMPQVTDVF